MRLPSDLNFINPNREQRKIKSTRGELFFDMKGRLIAALEEKPNGEYILYPTGEVFTCRLNALPKIEKIAYDIAIADQAEKEAEDVASH